MIFWVTSWISCPSASTGFDPGIEGRQDVYYSICCIPTSAFVEHTATVPRTFVEVQREIEKAARTLKETKDPETRRALLKEMSLLLKEADRINASPR